MTYNPEKHNRRSIRLKGYDYSQAGAYYFTICCYKRQCLLGKIIDGAMQRNFIGDTVEVVWQRLPEPFPCLELDAFIVMPNHVHGILLIKENENDTSKNQPLIAQSNSGSSLPRGTKSSSLGAIVQNFKSVATRRVNRLNRSSGTPLWQRDYYEEIIRDERAYQNIRQYIVENPLYWDKDEENPINF